jgi:hypothetical protein
MPVLKDLTYNCAERLAPCILEVIQQQLPRCRLHYNTFYLESLFLFDKFDAPTDLDGYEVALATSPNLYSISASIERFGVGPDYTEEGIRDLAYSLAPNLKSIYLFDKEPQYVD